MGVFVVGLVVSDPVCRWCEGGALRRRQADEEGWAGCAHVFYPARHETVLVGLSYNPPMSFELFDLLIGHTPKSPAPAAREGRVHSFGVDLLVFCAVADRL